MTIWTPLRPNTVQRRNKKVNKLTAAVFPMDYGGLSAGFKVLRVLCLSDRKIGVTLKKKTKKEGSICAFWW